MIKVLCMVICLLFSSNVFAVRTVNIDNSCIKLSDIYEELPSKELICNLNYGDERKISKERIRNILAIEGFKDHKVSQDVRIIRSGKFISNKDLQDKILNKLNSLFPDHRIEIQKVKVRNKIFTNNDGFLKIEFYGNKFGSIYANVSNGIKSYRVYLYAKAYKSVYVTSERIRKGEMFTGKFLKKEMDITSVRHDIIDNPEDFIAGRNVSPNKIITSNYVLDKPLNFAGDHVALIYSSGSISIATEGILEENAYLGKRVRVKNIASGKFIHAKAKSENQFHVAF